MGAASPQPDGREPTLLERAGTAAAGVGTLGSGRPRLRLAVQLAVVALVLAFIAAFVITQWKRLPDYDWRFAPGWLVLSAGCLVGYYAATAELWRAILRALGEHIDSRAARAIYGKSLVARYVPTSVLYVVGRVVLAERQGVAKRICLASVVYEIVSSLSAAVIVGAYFAITLPPIERHGARFAILAVIPVALGVLHPRVFRPLSDFALGKLGRERLPQVLPFSRVVGLVAFYVLAWALIGVGLFAFAAAVHPVDVSDLPYIASSMAVGFCVALVTFVVPAGLGTRDATLAAAMDVVLAANVAIAIAVAFRIFQTGVELVFVSGATALARRRPAPVGDPSPGGAP
jgi:hypothetical protein